MPALDVIDRFCTLTRHALQRRGARANTAILMYHRINRARQRLPWSYYSLDVPPQVFTRQLQFLYNHDIAVVPLTQLLTMPGSIPAVSITFDDGYRDFYDHAFALLRQYQFPATVFLPTALIDAGAGQFNGSALLSWAQVRKLHRAGIEFGSHTATHPRLWQIPPAQQQEELQHSKARLEEQLQTPIQCFSHPYAYPEADPDYTQQLRTNLRACNYRYAVTTRIGTVRNGDDPLCLKRIPINANDDQRMFEAKLHGAYDWLYLLQRGEKQWQQLRSARQTPDRTHA